MTANEILKSRFIAKADALNKEIKEIIKTHGETKVEEVTLAQVYQGMRGITGLVSETSLLDAQEGIRFRGYSIAELKEKLPVKHKGGEPLPEGLLYLMLFGELPTQEDAELITASLMRRSHVPQHVFDIIDAMPLRAHPMTMFVSAIMALQTESLFAAAYAKGISKKDYWDPTFEDALNLIARLPRIASYIYRRKYKNSEFIHPDGLQDWSGNFASMMGYKDNGGFKEMLRLYLTIHADHEGGNVSAHTTHLVGTALSDAYLCYAAGMNGLAGPLHGLANQEVIKWIYEMRTTLNTSMPTKEQIIAYVKKTIESGQVVPGYGHAVLRRTDPRFTVQMEFAQKHMPDDTLVRTVWNIYETVPPILESLGKIKNPWPNVDAHSGALLVHYGMVEYEFYTVLFAVSRALGVLSSLVWDRALGAPLERPKSITTESVKNWINSGAKEGGL